jgi:hypothetical protein
MMMDLFRDLLDVQLLDRHKRAIGRVDGITLELREGQAPRVVSMDVGPGTLADRVHPSLGRFVRRVLASVLRVSGETTAIPMHTIRDIGVDVEVAIDGEREPHLLEVEKLLRRIVSRIPGGAK